MPLRIRPATEADSFRIGCIGRDAFQHSLSKLIFPPHLHSKSETGDPGLDEAQWRAARNTKRMREGKPTFVVVDVPDDESSTENIVAFSQWETPLQPTSASKQGGGEADTVVVREPASLDTEALRAIMERIDTESKKALGPDGYSNMWYLMVLGVDPNHQRQGIGKMLVKHGLDLAVKDGKDAFLVATAEGRGMYHSLGFCEVGEPSKMGEVPFYPMLWRRPVSVAPAFT